MPVKKRASLGRSTSAARKVAASRAAEDPTETRNRLDDQRARQAASRAAQWTFMEGEAFQYDPGNNYDSHPQLYIRRMSNVCPYCNAHKWPAETRGLCCFGGKVKLPELHPPPEPMGLFT